MSESKKRKEPPVKTAVQEAREKKQRIEKEAMEKREQERRELVAKNTAELINRIPIDRQRLIHNAICAEALKTVPSNPLQTTWQVAHFSNAFCKQLFAEDLSIFCYHDLSKRFIIHDVTSSDLKISVFMKHLLKHFEQECPSGLVLMFNVDTLSAREV